MKLGLSVELLLSMDSYQVIGLFILPIFLTPTSITALSALRSTPVSCELPYDTRTFREYYEVIRKGPESGHGSEPGLILPRCWPMVNSIRKVSQLLHKINSA